jgi:hypothetical protein
MDTFQMMAGPSVAPANIKYTSPMPGTDQTFVIAELPWWFAFTGLFQWQWRQAAAAAGDEDPTGPYNRKSTMRIKNRPFGKKVRSSIADEETDDDEPPTSAPMWGRGIKNSACPPRADEESTLNYFQLDDVELPKSKPVLVGHLCEQEIFEEETWEDLACKLENGDEDGFDQLVASVNAKPEAPMSTTVETAEEQPLAVTEEQPAVVAEEPQQNRARSATEAVVAPELTDFFSVKTKKKPVKVKAAKVVEEPKKAVKEIEEPKKADSGSYVQVATAPSSTTPTKPVQIRLQGQIKVNSQKAKDGRPLNRGFIELKPSKENLKAFREHPLWSPTLDDKDIWWMDRDCSKNYEKQYGKDVVTFTIVMNDSGKMLQAKQVELLSSPWIRAQAEKAWRVEQWRMRAGMLAAKGEFE